MSLAFILPVRSALRRSRASIVVARGITTAAVRDRVNPMAP
jgi:hypothetical protein